MVTEEAKLVSAVRGSMMRTRRILLRYSEAVPDYGERGLGTYLDRIRSLTRKKRLSRDGVDALTRVCSIWDVRISDFLAKRDSLRFSPDELETVKENLKLYNSWLRANFQEANEK